MSNAQLDYSGEKETVIPHWDAEVQSPTVGLDYASSGLAFSGQLTMAQLVSYKLAPSHLIDDRILIPKVGQLVLHNTAQTHMGALAGTAFSQQFPLGMAIVGLAGTGTSVIVDYSSRATSLAKFGQRRYVKRVDTIDPKFIDARVEMQGYDSLKEGWDGPDSQAPGVTEIFKAIEFLDALPPSVTSPSATISSEGRVSWYWMTSRAKIQISFIAGGRIAYYAFAEGLAPLRNVSVFDGEIPRSLLEIIRNA